jgi:uncharacterized protein YgiM (DUF1202 family)
MRSSHWQLTMQGMVLLLALSACNLPSSSPPADVGATMIAATVSVLQTDAAASATAAVTPPPAPTEAPTPTLYRSPTATSEPRAPVVTKLSLCYTGPGPAYPVVSSVKEGTDVNILGVGSTAGWFVIENPTYHDRCWLEAANLQIDPNLNVAGLKVYNPPPTPGPKETPVPTAT